MATISEAKQSLIDAIETRAKDEASTAQDLSVLAGALQCLSYTQEPPKPRARKK